jgi:dihydropteroate synthase
MINDISAGSLDEAMFAVIAKHNVPYIMMHMRGTPQTMQSLTTYDDIIKKCCIIFSEKWLKHAV